MIANITNQDKLVEQKVNYFLDTVIHAATYMGWNKNLELESPPSLIEKILFRLSDEPERLEYLDNYFQQSFFTEDTFWEKYPTFNKVRTTVLEYNALGKKQKDLKKRLIDSVEFHSNLKMLYRDLNHSMPDDIMREVLKLVRCRHQLYDLIEGTTETHISLLKSFSIILVSEYFYRGYTTNEILLIIKNVFSSHLLRFPFPVNVTTLNEKKKYLKNGTLEDQLLGFSNVLKKAPVKGIIMVKVYGGKFPETFEFQYNEVKFWGLGHPTIQKIRGEMENDSDLYFFEKGAYVLASTSIEWNSTDSLLRNLHLKIEKELTFMSAMFNRKFNIDTTKNFIRLNSKMKFQASSWSNQQFETPLSLNTNIFSNNAFHVLKKIRGEAVDWFLQSEELFFRAYKSNATSDYWIYLETLLSYNRKDKAIKELVSKIMLLSEKTSNQELIIATLLSSFSHFSNGIHLLNISREKIITVMKGLEKNKISKEIRGLKYPFVKELIRDFDLELSKLDYEKAKTYYYRIMTEAYENRNFFVHKGMESKSSKIKLSVSLTRIVIRLRLQILEALKKGENNTPFDLLINKLASDGAKFVEK